MPKTPANRKTYRPRQSDTSLAESATATAMRESVHPDDSDDSKPAQTEAPPANDRVPPPAPDDPLSDKSAPPATTQHASQPRSTHSPGAHSSTAAEAAFRDRAQAPVSRVP